MGIFSRKRAVGIVDTRGSRIQGWAHDPSLAGPVTVEFFLDGQKIGTALADRYRHDLVSVSPNGRCAFDFSIPPKWLDSTRRTIEVRPQGSSTPLFNGTFELYLASNWYHLGLLHWILRTGWWYLDGTVKGDAAELTGKFIPPPGLDDGRIGVNGRPLQLTTKSEPSKVWNTALAPDMCVRTFSAKVPFDAGAKHLHFSFGLERSFRLLHDLYYPLFDVPMPELERRGRVAGQVSEFLFDLGGYSNAIRLDTIAERFTGRPLAGVGPVLDWGCGCGRVARFVARTDADLYGVDIDNENAAWCRQNIGDNFTGIAAEPPTPFADNFFGAIYGISIFTHLTSHFETLWLKELYRIAKPGALLLLSVHGGVAAATAGMLEHVFPQEGATGFVDIGRNPDIDRVTKGSEYYRNVFHQAGYILQVWGEFFEILSIEEGIIGNSQDLVVARKPLQR